MATIILVHGAYGSPEENWFPWLKQQLTTRGHTVIIPKLPTPEHQNLTNWMTAFKQQTSILNEDTHTNTIFVAHSVGPAFVLSVLEQLKHPVTACFFIAGFLGLLNNKEVDHINTTIVTKKFNWKKIKQNCNQFILYNSDNDPYVPLDRGKEFAKLVNGTLRVISGAGHFNKAAGYTQFPRLLEDILSMVSEQHDKSSDGIIH